jgi:TetR/AcrR family transcriptional regulator, cholesterol catabolism regulator
MDYRALGCKNNRRATVVRTMNAPTSAAHDDDVVAPRRGRVRQVTQDRLLETAAQLFRKNGYDATSTRDLSDALGIQKASLYHHIRGKEDLLFAICTESLARIQFAVEKAEAAPLETRLQAMIDAHLEAALSDRDMHATMLAELGKLSAERQAEVREERDRHAGLFRDTITEAQNKGVIRKDIPARYLTLSLLNLLNWTIFWFDPNGERSVPEIAGFLGSIYLDGSRPR